MESPSREVLGTTHLIRFELQTQGPQGKLSECRVTEKGEQFHSAEITQNWICLVPDLLCWCGSVVFSCQIGSDANSLLSLICKKGSGQIVGVIVDNSNLN